MLQLDVQAVVDHLKEAVPGFVEVGLARDLAAVRPNTVRWPSAWVILLAETAEANRYRRRGRRRAAIQPGKPTTSC